MSIPNVNSNVNVNNRQRNYTDMLNGTSETGSTKRLNAVFSNEDNSNLGIDDFLTLMIAQLTNQDFTNPVDDTQYVAQMAQFSSLAAMKELSENSNKSYALSLLGKTCTASLNQIGGDVKQVTGKVTSIALVDNDYRLTIDGQEFSMSQISLVSDSAEA